MKIVYAVIFSIILLSSIGTVHTVSAEKVPLWIKNTAQWYAEGKVSEDEFLNAIKFLINNGILILDEDKTAQDNIVVVVPTNDIPNVNTLEIPVSDSEAKEELLSSDLDLITFKVIQMQELAKNPTIIQAVKDSNKKFRDMDEPEAYIISKDKEWKNTPKNQISPFMGSLIENNISKILKQKQKISTDEFGDVIFPEIIITNEFGANVAITGRTDDYNQGDEGWWLRALKKDVQIRDVLWDDSAKIFSSDIVIKIVDMKGKFIGVLNAATPIR